MTTRCVLGVDIGTSSSKAVLVGEDGAILAQAAVAHAVSRPRSGHVEMDGEVWWEEFCSLARRVLADASALRPEVRAVGVSGMGPCALLTDGAGAPLRPAILYGVDTRAGRQIERMTEELGEREIVRVGGSRLSAQAVGPKLAWLAEREPEVFDRARRLFMPASWLAFRLTGAYVLDRHSASQCSPLYDVDGERWHAEWWDRYAGRIEAPELLWAGDIAGRVTAAAAAASGLPLGIPVIAGTIDAWSEAVSVGALGEGDLMIMYGTTMFLVVATAEALRSPSMWTTAGVAPHSTSLAGGLAASGALTDWARELTGGDYPELLAEAAASGVGARGLLALPYFAGERTPILDPDARGAVIGLSLSHGRGDLYRALLESTGFGVRDNLEAMRESGAEIRRTVCVGGGVRGGLWPQIVSDITGLEQQIPRHTVGASFGAAFLAACAVADPSAPPSIEEWNPVEARVLPDGRVSERYDRLFGMYRELYASTRRLSHALAADQREPA